MTFHRCSKTAAVFPAINYPSFPLTSPSYGLERTNCRKSSAGYQGEPVQPQFYVH